MSAILAQTVAGPLVHFLAYRAKKRKAADKTAFVRKIKLEWAPLFVEYHRRRRLGQVWIRSETASDAKLFPFARARITAMAGAVPPPITRLSDLGGDRNTIEVLNQRLAP